MAKAQSDRLPAGVFKLLLGERRQHLKNGCAQLSCFSTQMSTSASLFPKCRRAETKSVNKLPRLSSPLQRNLLASMPLLKFFWICANLLACDRVIGCLWRLCPLSAWLLVYYGWLAHFRCLLFFCCNMLTQLRSLSPPLVRRWVVQAIYIVVVGRLLSQPSSTSLFLAN